MIEIDGKAIPLEPGKHYMLAVDPRYVMAQPVDTFLEWAAQEGIHIGLFEAHGMENFRIVNIEQPEQPTASSERLLDLAKRGAYDLHRKNCNSDRGTHFNPEGGWGEFGLCKHPDCVLAHGG